ncbi:hypothetical protein [Dapis sp. BLCC M229]|uniref:hypothetical protein n=1 Tax=Dapis sp. BLCC M229 TaxID=3400188 RepID=UPI003CF311BE
MGDVCAALRRKTRSVASAKQEASSKAQNMFWVLGKFSRTDVRLSEEQLSFCA